MWISVIKLVILVLINIIFTVIFNYDSNQAFQQMVISLLIIDFIKE